MEIKVADVAELVDARDLKSPGATEITHLSDLTRADNPNEPGGDPAILSNTRPLFGLAGRSSKTWANVFVSMRARTGLMIRARDGLFRADRRHQFRAGRLAYDVRRCVVLCDRRARVEFRNVS